MIFAFSLLVSGMPRAFLPFSVITYCPLSGEVVYPFRVRSRRCIIAVGNSFPDSLAICVALAGLSFKSMFSSILHLIGDKLILLTRFLNSLLCSAVYLKFSSAFEVELVVWL